MKLQLEERNIKKNVNFTSCAYRCHGRVQVLDTRIYQDMRHVLYQLSMNFTVSTNGNTDFMRYLYRENGESIKKLLWWKNLVYCTLVEYTMLSNFWQRNTGEYICIRDLGMLTYLVYNVNKKNVIYCLQFIISNELMNKLMRSRRLTEYYYLSIKKYVRKKIVLQQISEISALYDRILFRFFEVVSSEDLVSNAII